MINKLLRIFVIIISFFFITGFVPILSLIGPGVTALTSGSMYKASAQFIINQGIEKETGKNSLTIIKDTFVKEEINEKNQKKSFNEVLMKLVENRIKITRKKLRDQNLQKLVTNRINVTRSILKLNSTNQ